MFNWFKRWFVALRRTTPRVFKVERRKTPYLTKEEFDVLKSKDLEALRFFKEGENGSWICKWCEREARMKSVQHDVWDGRGGSKLITRILIQCPHCAPSPVENGQKGLPVRDASITFTMNVMKRVHSAIKEDSTPQSHH